MDEQRALLNSLMGINRNRDREHEEITNFRDDRLCKFYLLDMCPHDMFVNTKMDFGPCERVHSDELKEEFLKSSDHSIFDAEIERDFTQRISDIDRTIRRSRARVEEEKGEDSSNPDVNPELLRIHTEIERLTAEAESAGDNGDIDKAQELMAKVDQLTTEKSNVMDRISDQRRALLQRTGVDVNKKLRVCDVCGSFLSILDSDKRLADHFLGKQHIGYQTMRDALEAIKKRKEEARKLGGGEERSRRGDSRERPSDDRRRGDSRERDRDRERRRDRSRDRGGSRDRDRDRGRYDRDRRRRDDSRDRDRDRDRRR